MITPSFALTATERVLPRLTLDFITASLDSRITFTRSGATATRVNTSGFIEAMAADTPRFDFNPVTLVCRGLLIEESRTNNFTYSEDFRNTATAGSLRPWIYQNATVSIDTLTAPDNTLTADTIIENTATTSHGVIQTFLTTSGTPTTLSFYVKAKERTQASAQFGAAGYGTLVTVIFDLVALTATVTSGTATATIADAGNGWRRCTCTATPTVTALVNHFMLLASGGTNVYAGDGASGAYYWGAQVEAGAFPTSYIPTVAATVTRNADIATMTGTNFSDWYNASEGAAVIQTLPSTISNTRPAIRFDDNTANESIALRGVAADPQLFVVDGGSTQATLDAGTITANTVYKLGGAWKASSFATAINGAAAVTSASGTLPTVTQARLGSDGTNYFNGHLQNLRYWPQRLTNAEVQAFSK